MKIQDETNGSHRISKAMNFFTALTRIDHWQ
jgi:hypothetical protein